MTNKSIIDSSLKYSIPDQKYKNFVSNKYVKSLVVYCSDTLNRDVFNAGYVHSKVLKEEKTQMPCHFIILTDGTIEQLLPLNATGDVISYLDSASWYVCMVGGLNEAGKKEVNFNEQQMTSLTFLMKKLDEDHGNLFKRFFINNEVVALRV